MVFVISEIIGWKISGMMYMDEICEVVSKVLIMVLIVLVIVIGVGIIVIYFVIWLIIKLLRCIVVLVEKISEGDLIEMIEINLKDEFGVLS